MNFFDGFDRKISVIFGNPIEGGAGWGVVAGGGFFYIINFQFTESVGVSLVT